MAYSYYYVDPVGGNDANSGALGDEWQTLQHAFDSVVDGADGVQINLKDTGPDVLAGTLSTAAYVAANGKSTIAKHFIIRGYTAAADDGGIGEIDGNNGGFTLFNATTDDMQGVGLIDLELHNSGATYIVWPDAYSGIYRCEFYDCAGFAALRTTYGVVRECYFHDCTGNYCVFDNNNSNFMYNVLDATTNSVGGFGLGNSGSLVLHNCILLSTGLYGVSSNLQAVVSNNSFYDEDGGAGTIGVNTTADSVTVQNNVFANFSGVGAIGVNATATAQFCHIGPNAFWNCTTNVVNAAKITPLPSPDIALGANPFTNAPALDFTLTATSTARNVAWPGGFLSGSTELYLDVGASQHVDPSGGGRRPRIRRHGV